MKTALKLGTSQCNESKKYYIQKLLSKFDIVRQKIYCNVDFHENSPKDYTVVYFKKYSERNVQKY